MQSAHTSAFITFIAFVALTMLITYWASKRTSSAEDFYTAGRSIPGWQNGIAIAGDYMSAASFLGIAGLIALFGFDGFLYSVGWLVAYLLILLVVAEPLRNTGRYTLADMVAYRMRSRSIRSIAALNTLAIVTFYMIAQLVGAGLIINLLIGLEVEVAIIVVGILMIFYVVFGGMLATTWVQIIKAFLLMGGTVILTFLVLKEFNFSVIAMFDQVADEFGQSFHEPGLKYTSPLDNISLSVGLILGTAGLPHILVRFYTVPNAKEARKSVVWAMFIIGAFYVMTIFLGLGAATLVGHKAIKAADISGNMAAPLLAEVLGGELLLAFIAAVGFATILAVVAGLVISGAGAFAHDFYAYVIRNGNASEEEQINVARWASVGVGIVSIILALLAKEQNVAFLVSLAFAVAASANLPVILFSIFWRRFNTSGAVIGMLAGLISSLVLVVLSPNVMGEGSAIFPLQNPALVSVPIGFLGAIIGTFLTRDYIAEEKHTELSVRATTGIGAE